MFHFYSRILFFVGFLLGILIVVSYHRFIKYDHLLYKTSNSHVNLCKKVLNEYENWYNKSHIQRKDIPFDELRYGNENNYLESQFLFKKVKVMCLILVKNIKNIVAAKETWAQGCHKVIFVDLSVNKRKIQPILKRNSVQDSSWVLLCQALKNLPRKNYDWILVVNDDTFVIMENLRKFVAPLDSKQPFYLGHPVKFWNTIYNLGQAGYILSNGAVELMKSSKKSCSSQTTNWNREDYHLGRYLADLNITVFDTSDQFGLSTFNANNLNGMLFNSNAIRQQSVCPSKCCSKLLITFNAIQGSRMYTYYYLLYHLQIFNKGTLGNAPYKSMTEDDEVWKGFLREKGYPTNVTSNQYYKIWVDLVGDPTSFLKRNHQTDIEL